MKFTVLGIKSDFSNFKLTGQMLHLITLFFMYIVTILKNIKIRKKKILLKTF